MPFRMSRARCSSIWKKAKERPTLASEPFETRWSRLRTRQCIYVSSAVSDSIQKDKKDTRTAPA